MTSWERHEVVRRWAQTAFTVALGTSSIVLMVTGIVLIWVEILK